jgi:hypothetical protein
MTEQLDDVWHSRDLPVLREVCRTNQQQRGPVDLEPISETLGIGYEQVTAAALNLERDGLVELLYGFGAGVTHVKDVTGQALREVGLWPSPDTALDRMIAALQEIAANTDDEDTRSRARKILEGFAGAGRQIGVAVTAAALTGQRVPLQYPDSAFGWAFTGHAARSYSLISPARTCLRRSFQPVREGVAGRGFGGC